MDMLKPKLFLMLIVLSVSLIAISQSLRSSAEAFSAAREVPRGALIYLQIEDLPVLTKFWNESKLKADYLESVNFAEFQDRHLALKILSRWEEFNAASGFSFDLEAFSGLSETKAALAVYDIGRLEMVFVAPLSDEKFAATMFFQKREAFESETLADGTTVYSAKVEADRGRQAQKLFFVNKNGRFVLATSEKLFAQTLANLDGTAKNNALADEPSFQKLSEKITPHVATVWLNQEKLNDDYYFRRYWLMSEVKSLKNIRAAMFDVEISESNLIERREFLLKENGAPESLGKISASDLSATQSMILPNMPLAKIQNVRGNSELATKLIFETLFDRVSLRESSAKPTFDWRDYENRDFEATESDDDYSYLDDDFEREINDEAEGASGVSVREAQEKKEKELSAEVNKILHAAQPEISLTATNPHFEPGLPFIEFRRVAVLQLNAPANFRREVFEKTLAEVWQNRLTIGGKDANLSWTERAENNQTWRELELPALGRKFGYLLSGDKLFISNSIAFLNEVSANVAPKAETIAEAEDLDEFTALRFERREEIFDSVMQKLAQEEGAEQDFFVGNVGSLLDILQQTERIEIRRATKGNFRREELKFVLK